MMRNVNVNEPQNQQSCQTSVMVSAVRIEAVNLFQGFEFLTDSYENQYNLSILFCDKIIKILRSQKIDDDYEIDCKYWREVKKELKKL